MFHLGFLRGTDGLLTFPHGPRFIPADTAQYRLIPPNTGMESFPAVMAPRREMRPIRPQSRPIKLDQTCSSRFPRPFVQFFHPIRQFSSPTPVRREMLRVKGPFCKMLRVKNSQSACLYWVVAGSLPRNFCVAGPDPKKTQCLQACCGCCGSSRGKCVEQRTLCRSLCWFRWRRSLEQFEIRCPLCRWVLFGAIRGYSGQKNWFGGKSRPNRPANPAKSRQRMWRKGRGRWSVRAVSIKLNQTKSRCCRDIPIAAIRPRFCAF